MPQKLPRIFDPYFTTRESGKGGGICCTSAHGIVHSSAVPTGRPTLLCTGFANRSMKGGQLFWEIADISKSR
jgi:hypothetical protein